jgi:hypothetical protein
MVPSAPRYPLVILTRVPSLSIVAVLSYGEEFFFQSK